MSYKWFNDRGVRNINGAAFIMKNRRRSCQMTGGDVIDVNLRGPNKNVYDCRDYASRCSCDIH